MLHTLR